MPPTQITDRINNGLPGRPFSVSAASEKEYTSGGGFSPFLTQYYQALPEFVDQSKVPLGNQTFTDMLDDVQVFSAVHTLKQAVISQAMQTSPRITDDKDPRHKQAVEMAEFCQRCLERLKNFRTETLYQLLDAIPYGHKIAEQVYEIADSGPDAGKIVPKALKVKPLTSYSFVVDAFMNTICFLVAIPGQSNQRFVNGMMLNGANKPANLLPRQKFAVLTLLCRDGDPRGWAWLNAVYTPWAVKQKCSLDYAKFMEEFAGPSLIGTTAPGAQDTPILNADGTAAMDATGNILYESPEQKMLRSLLGFRNATAMALPNGADVKTLFSFTDGTAFRACIDLMNREIGQGVLFQILATQEAQHQSRAAAQTHQDILELPIQYIRTRVEEMIQNDLFANWILLNYGREMLEFCPVCNLGDTEEQNFAANAGAVAKLMTSKYFDASQLRQIDARLGVPQRTDEEAKKRGQLLTMPLTQAAQAQQQRAAGAGQPASKVQGVQEQQQQRAA